MAFGRRCDERASVNGLPKVSHALPELVSQDTADLKSFENKGFLNRHKKRWWARRDSNPQPIRYERTALTS
jgi:hypothetical protein